MCPADDYFDQRLCELERLLAERPDHPSAKTARMLCRRARFRRSREYLCAAPRLRRHVLGDIRSATRSLERTSHDRPRRLPAPFGRPS